MGRAKDLEVGVDILASAISDEGVITIQTGDVINGEVEGVDAELWQTPGIVSRPAEATAGESAAQGICIPLTDRKVCIATRDVRSAEIAGALKPGETCVYAPGADGKSQGRILLRNDGTVTTYGTSDNTPDGDGWYWQLGPEGIEAVWPFGTLKFDENGLTIKHKSGATLALGKLPVSLPVPLDSVQSFVRVEAGVAELVGSVCKIGAGSAHVGAAMNPSPTPAPSPGSTTVLISP